jgi:hypothetical protein
VVAGADAGGEADGGADGGAGGAAGAEAGGGAGVAAAVDAGVDADGEVAGAAGAAAGGTTNGVGGATAAATVGATIGCCGFAADGCGGGGVSTVAADADDPGNVLCFDPVVDAKVAIAMGGAVAAGEAAAPPAGGVGVGVLSELGAVADAAADGGMAGASPMTHSVTIDPSANARTLAATIRIAGRIQPCRCRIGRRCPVAVTMAQTTPAQTTSGKTSPRLRRPGHGGRTCRAACSGPKTKYDVSRWGDGDWIPPLLRHCKRRPRRNGIAGKSQCPVLVRRRLAGASESVHS